MEIVDEVESELDEVLGVVIASDGDFVVEPELAAGALI